mmetsp:Transcript_12203/g.18253  ORF Transcript_12203/g.18253 Transcript_12203/m.18253 type:complete len:166 (-) Transcript_12203:79-576(-)
MMSNINRCFLRRGMTTAPNKSQSFRPIKGLQEFIDKSTPKGEEPKTGRAWTVVELRQKSFSDLHKLWWVVYKEKNVLLTEKLVARRNGKPNIKSPDRILKINKTLSALRHVIDERAKFKANIEAKKLEQEKKEKFLAVRASALERGVVPKNAPDVIAAEKAKFSE